MLAHAGRRSRHLSSCVQQTPGHRPGNLYYDVDGNGVAVRVLFATLVGQIGTLDFTDFTTDLPPGT